MGTIHPDVTNNHLRGYPGERAFLTPFLAGFDITWGRRRSARNTELSVYFLKPEAFIAETFGFSQEILLVFSEYPTLEARTIQAAEQFLSDDPGKGRVERLTYFLVSSTVDGNPTDWIRSYMAANHEARLVVAFSTSALSTSGGDNWFVRNRISEQLFSRDLFDFRLPLETDTYFFGREALLLDYLDAARRGENRGVFGLRKTGKTSFLFQLRKSLADKDIAGLYYDCKSPSIRQLNWEELLTDVCDRIWAALRRRGRFHVPKDRRRIGTAFSDLLALVPVGRRIVLIFDEIEYISPYARQDEHWRTQYIPFWQTIWAAQSQRRVLSVVLAGVNPNIVEIDRIEGIQNPLFGIVSSKYLQGLGLDEVRRMLHVLGRRMGLKFTDNATRYLHSRYGGHPLLTRLACSDVHQSHYRARTERPISVAERDLRATEDDRDANLIFYCRHVVSELQDFYPDEYDMLEFLSLGKVQDFLELASHPEYVNHLKYYGLIQDQSGVPVIAIPVVGRYVALDEARREGRQTILSVVPTHRRRSWLGRRLKMILEDVKEVERLARLSQQPELYGPNSVPDTHALIAQSVVDTEVQFRDFVGECHRCLVEGIENFGKSIGRNGYFWNDVRNAYPFLFEALHRITLYRHRTHHRQLSGSAETSYQKFLNRDLEGRNPTQVPESWFVLQQCVLDGLHSSLQCEISRLGS